MAKVLAKAREDELKSQGYYPFGLMLEWEHDYDAAAVTKLTNAFSSLGATLGDDIPQDSIIGFFLTGERTLMFFGHAKSNIALQNFVTSITHGTPIKGTAYHVVEVEDLWGMFKAP
jgi:hypothetical protein